MADSIQFRRGLRSTVKPLPVGMPGFIEDEERLLIGKGDGTNTELPNKADMDNLNLQMADIAIIPYGTDDDIAFANAINYALANNKPLKIPNKTITLTHGYPNLNKRFSIKGEGYQSKIIFKPVTSNDILFDFNIDNAILSEKTDEGTMNGFILKDFSIYSDRSIRANAIHFMGFDNVKIDNVFIYGHKGYGFKAENCRECNISGLRTRWNGDYENQISSVILNSVNGDGTNFMYFNQLFAIYSFWHLLELNQCSNFFFSNVMFHNIPTNHTPSETYCSQQFGDNPNCYTEFFGNIDYYKPTRMLKATNSSIYISNGIFNTSSGDYSIELDSSNIKISNAYLNSGIVKFMKLTNNTKVFLSNCVYDNTGDLYDDDGTCIVTGTLIPGANINTGMANVPEYGLRGKPATLFGISPTNGDSVIHFDYMQGGITRRTCFTVIQNGTNARFTPPSGSGGVIKLGDRPLNESFQVGDTWCQNGFMVMAHSGFIDNIMQMQPICAGTTAQRPSNIGVGFQYFDTTLGKPIWLKSSGVWIDATGTTI